MTALTDLAVFNWVFWQERPWLIIALALTAGLFALWKVRTRTEPLSENKGLNALSQLAIALSPFWVFLLGGVIFALASIIITLDPTEKPDDLRWHVLALVGMITALGGVLASPLALIRLFATERQTKTAERQFDISKEQFRISNEGHITDRINKAVEQLGNHKTVKTNDIEETVPNIEVRIGALFALERIAQDSVRDHVSIMEIICAYIRENARKPSNLDIVRTQKNRKELADKLNCTESDLDDEQLAYTQDFLPPRDDIQTALNILGRRSQRGIEAENANDPKFAINLARSHLEGAHFHDLNFENASMEFTSLQSAYLGFSHFKGASFFEANLIGARLYDGDFSNASFWGTDLRNTSCRNTIFNGATLEDVNLRFAALHDTNFKCVQFRNVLIDETSSVIRPEFQGSLLSNCGWEKIRWLDATFDTTAVYDQNTQTPTILPKNSGAPHKIEKEHPMESYLDIWRAWKVENNYTSDEN